ncbi:hypothetical protein [Burkholderia sp. PAMC 26561]|uniref:hypothetical protein n=1 Tax=Burkholderia sp. PAMC 26561 TaxID=1795043 RepID=UPI00084CFC55|nr:hypothetical protein [Burkholderia sp. PAMC 26561]
MPRDPNRQSSRIPVPSPYEKRLQQTDCKLRDALDRLVNGAPRNDASLERCHHFSVANLAREAGVARNAIYTNHKAMIEALRHAAKQRVVPSKLENWQDKLGQQRAVIEVLKIEQRRLATENAALLARVIEAETIAARHQRQNARFLKERDEACRPVTIVSRPSK